MAGTRKGRKGRKIGRATDKCARYRAAGTREKNRDRRLLRHVRRHPNDLQATEGLR